MYESTWLQLVNGEKKITHKTDVVVGLQHKDGPRKPGRVCIADIITYIFLWFLCVVSGPSGRAPPEGARPWRKTNNLETSLPEAIKAEPSYDSWHPERRGRGTGELAF